LIYNHKTRKVYDMSIDELEEQIEKLLDERDKLEEKCDTLPKCEEEDGCETCQVYEKISAIDDKIEALEEKIEALMGEEEEDED
jgi:prefoldin subunit 5